MLKWAAFIFVSMVVNVTMPVVAGPVDSVSASSCSATEQRRGRRSMDMRRYEPASGHTLQLFETWMVELFCAKSRNRHHFDGDATSCTRQALGKPVAGCSAPIRDQGVEVFFRAAPDGAEFLRMVETYQGCLRQRIDVARGERSRSGGHSVTGRADP